jgi:CoA:oxalate CoA-transferase
MFGPIETRDGYVMVAIASEKTFQNLMQVIGHVEWVSDPRFAKYANRRDNWAHLMEGVEAWSRSVTTENCLAALNAEGVPSSAYRTVKQALADPQIAHRGALARRRNLQGAQPAVPHVRRQSIGGQKNGDARRAYACLSEGNRA